MNLVKEKQGGDIEWSHMQVPHGVLKRQSQKQLLDIIGELKECNNEIFPILTLNYSNLKQIYFIKKYPTTGSHNLIIDLSNNIFSHILSLFNKNIRD